MFCPLNGWIFAGHGSNLDTSKSKEYALTSLEIKVLKRIPWQIRLSEISLKFVSCKITESEDFQRVKQVPKYINFENVFTHSSGDSRHFSVFIHEHVENAQLS